MSTATNIMMSRHVAASSHKLCSLILVAVLAGLLIYQTTLVSGFIKFGYILNTTACDICDELRTYSGRNVFCCLAQSKCCG